MSWIRTFMKPVKLCVENPDYPVSWIFKDPPWELSGGTKQTCIMAAAYILSLDVSTVVEIGAWQGFSSFMLARALVSNSRDPMLVTIDINKRALDRSKAQVGDLPIKHKFVESDSMGLDLSKFLDGRKPGLSFIDGNHEYEWCKNDLEICKKAMCPYGIMVVHDYSKGFPGVYQAVNEFAEHTGSAKIYMKENRESTDYRTAILQLPGDY